MPRCRLNKRAKVFYVEPVRLLCLPDEPCVLKNSRHTPKRKDFDFEGQLLFEYPSSAAETVKNTARGVARDGEKPSETASKGGVLVPQLVLRWDFRVSFPPPLEEAIDAGKLDPSDVLPANLKSLHVEYERVATKILFDLDLIADARRRGIDPSTGVPPRMEKHRVALEQRFKDEPPRLEHALDVMMDAYGEGFGEEAAGEFRKAIVARHHGVDVLADTAMPMHRPLEAAVKAGAFGRDEDGGPILPGREEIDAITEDLADRLRDLPEDSPIRAELFRQYADDFGDDAAGMLDEWLRRQAKLDEVVMSDAYDPGHPWHYYHEGDGAEPIPVAAIPAAEMAFDELGAKLPKDPKKRRRVLSSMLQDATRQLNEDERRYSQLVDDDFDALSEYDRNIAHNSNDALAWASAIALKYNQIRFTKGRIRLLTELAAARST